MLRLFVIACLLLTACSVPPPKIVPGTRIATESGMVDGYSSDERVVRWFDIPYAQPPIGDLRWRAPRPPTDSDELLLRRPDPLMCPQMPGETSGVSGEDPVGTEDCLYLDIVAPSNFAAQDLPVMFWIHGGGNVTGRKGTYDFTELAAREQVVVVTINYRLGPLGWFTHPALQAEATDLDRSSNFGTLDIIAALEWTQRNIARFGGDPNNVTIFGESAGAHNVYALLASPLADGLFHKAISQSGYTTSVTPRQAFNQAREFPQIDRGAWEVIDAAGLDPALATGEQLRHLSAAELLTAYNGLEKDHLAPLTTADGVVIPEQGLLATLADPHFNKSVPVLAGSNRDEVSLWLGLNRYFVDSEPVLFGLLPPKLSVRDPELYQYWIDLRSRGWKARGVDEPLAALEQAGYKHLYAYRFDWDEQADNWFFPFSEILGAAHAAEIAFVMGAPMYGSIGDYMYPDTESASDLTAVMMGAWGAFAKSGHPGEVKGRVWPPFSGAGPHTMVLDSGSEAAISATPLSLESLLQEAAKPSPLTATERCMLVWELVTNIGEPAYSDYRRWNGGECSDVDARAEKLAIRAALEQEFGSATVP